MDDVEVRPLKGLKKNADRERIAARVSNFIASDEAPKVPHVVRLNQGFFTAQRLREANRGKRRTTKGKKVTGK